jgi:type IV secretory pathway TraG/TraD family ATPase VirD4
MNLDPNSQIILIDGERPIIGGKVFYYEDEEVKKKIIAPKIL